MLAKQFGATVIATAGSPEKCEACRKLGADVAIDYNKEDFVAVTKEATGKKGANLILDMIGGDYVDRNFDAAAVEGRIVQIATQKGTKVTADLRRLMLKRLTLTGSTLRARPVSDKAEIARALEAKVWPLLEAGKVRPVIDSTFPLAKATEAHARMETSLHIGKIMLEVAV
jgi:NADPH2:quinone reductase